MSELDYRVVVTREGDDWLATVPAAEPAQTFARNLETLDRYVREAIVLAVDLADEQADDLRLSWEYHTGDRKLDKSLARLRDQRAEVEQFRTDVEARTAAYAQRLAAAHYSVRDVSALLGVSRARAQQLVPSGRELGAVVKRSVARGREAAAFGRELAAAAKTGPGSPTRGKVAKAAATKPVKPAKPVKPVKR